MEIANQIVALIRQCVDMGIAVLQACMPICLAICQAVVAALGQIGPALTAVLTAVAIVATASSGPGGTASNPPVKPPALASPTASTKPSTPIGDATAALSLPGEIAAVDAGSLGSRPTDRQRDTTSASAVIASAARSAVGKQMWTQYAGTQGGAYGCAASVSEVLQQAGYSYADSASVRGLERQLEAKGWTVTTQPQPGDVVLGYRTDPDRSGGDGAHTGIVGPNGTVYNNVSGPATWQSTDLGAFNSRQYAYGVVYLHPPSGASPLAS